MCSVKEIASGQYAHFKDVSEFQEEVKNLMDRQSKNDEERLEMLEDDVVRLEKHIKVLAQAILDLQNSKK